MAGRTSEANHTVSHASRGKAGSTGASLAHTRRGGALATTPDREGLLPGADELFRGIYTRADAAATEIIAVTSALAGEGKSTVSIGLAVAYAEDFPERRVLLVESDLTTSTLAGDFGMEASPGLADYLLEEQLLESVIRPTAL